MSQIATKTLYIPFLRNDLGEEPGSKSHGIHLDGMGSKATDCNGTLPLRLQGLSGAPPSSSRVNALLSPLGQISAPLLPRERPDCRHSSGGTLRPAHHGSNAAQTDFLRGMAMRMRISASTSPSTDNIAVYLTYVE